MLSFLCTVIIHCHSVCASDEEEIITTRKSYSFDAPIRNTERAIKKVLKDPDADTFNFSGLNLDNGELIYVIQGLKDRYLVETDRDSDGSDSQVYSKPAPAPIFMLNLESSRIDAAGFLTFLVALENALINQEIPTVGAMKIKANFSADENYINTFIRRCPHLASSKIDITY